MASQQLHVQPDGHRWSVLHNGEIRASFSTRTRAVLMAREWAKTLGAQLTVADADGDIIERRAYRQAARGRQA